MAMAGAAFLRSVAAKTAARAPPRLPSALEERLQHHGLLLPTSSNRLWLSRFYTSTGSTGPTNRRGPQTHNKGFLNDEEWDRVKVAFIEAAPGAAVLSVIVGYGLMRTLWRHPAPDHSREADTDAISVKRPARMVEMQQENERLRDMDAISMERSAKIVEMQEENERLRAALLDCKRSLIETYAAITRASRTK